MKVLPRTLKTLKDRGEKISMVVCYDYPSAVLVEKAGVEGIIVGVSCGKTMLGYDDSTSITMEELIHHTRAVTRGAKTPIVIADMPYMSYWNVEKAVENSGRFVKEAKADGVKIEGGGRVKNIVSAVTNAGIPALGHIGASLFIMELDGAVEKGTSAEEAKSIIEDVKSLEDAGVFAILMEAVPQQVMEIVMSKANVPIISLGSGAVSDGQILIWHEMMGISDVFIPKCVKRYAELGDAALSALNKFKAEVRSGAFPEEKHTFFMSDVELKKLKE